MRNKILIFSLLAVVGVTVLAVAAGVTVFALTGDAPVQTEKVSLAQPVEIVPVEVEPVNVVKPVLKHDRAKYAGYAGEGGCPFSHSKAQLTQVETPSEDPVLDNQLLTLAK